MQNEKKNPTLELANVVNYMLNVLVHEFPTDFISPEYLILAILDNKNNHAYMFLETILTEKTMNELRDVFSSSIQEHSKPQLKNNNPTRRRKKEIPKCSVPNTCFCPY